MNPFKRSSARYGATPEPDTPYRRAGQAWDERLGSARAQARNWRLMAFGCLALAIGTGGGLVWRSATATVTPWVVEVDRLGAARSAGPAVAGYRPSDPQIAWHLAQFVKDVRSIPADPVVMRESWLRAYAYAAGEGLLALNAYARDADPFRRVGREQVTAEIASVVRASPSSFRAEWVERRYAEGALVQTERWTAVLTVDLRPPSDPEGLRRNPLGVFVTAFAWSREFA